MGKNEGICKGPEEMRLFFEAVAQRKPPLRPYYRAGYLSDGNKKMIFEIHELPRMANKWTLLKSCN